AVVMDDRGDLLEGIERARVHVAGLGAHDRRAVEPAEGLAERVGPHPALLIGGDAMNASSAKTEHLERREDSDVRFVADDHADRRRAKQPVLLDMPAGLFELGMATRR